MTQNIGGDRLIGLRGRGADRFAENIHALIPGHFRDITQAEPGAETGSDRMLDDRPPRKLRHMRDFRAIGLSPEADDMGLRRDWSAQA